MVIAKALSLFSSMITRLVEGNKAMSDNDSQHR